MSGAERPYGGYTLLGADRKPFASATPGTLGGHRRSRLYGRLDCPSALRALARGGHYASQRVFFADESTAVAAGYRPCAVCLPARYREWRAGRPRLRDDRPVPHTAAELTALLGLLTAGNRIRSISVGHSRDAASRAAALACAEAWQARGGDVLTVVDWPEDAASWLRPATRLAAGAPDAWVIAAAPPGFTRLARRLRRSTAWDPARTYAFSSLATPDLAATSTLQGLRGAAPDGSTWHIHHAWLTYLLPG